MEIVTVCEKSVDLNCMKQLADDEVVLNFVATKLQDIMLLIMMMKMMMVTITSTKTSTTRIIIIIFVLQFLLPDGRRVSLAA